MANPLIIDLSHHNDPYDFGVIKDNGTIGIIHKATQGIGYSDPTYWDRQREAVAAGLEWASYHFLEHGDVEMQMQNYLYIVQPEDGDRVCLDYEPYGDGEAPTLDDLHEAVSYLLDYGMNLQVAVYSGHLIKEHLGSAHDELLAQTSLWLAQYTDDALQVTWPSNTWDVVTLWQYTDSAAVAGVSAACDGNKFNGSEEQARKWFHPDAYVPEPTPLPEPVRIEIYVPAGVEVQVNVRRVGDE